ncbi:unnamed protein product [Paramecium primaurelia]|uniref:Uncharacterized protein n=1 Tax=Paramecium primaurelia TaxID=5886 RepID=A0A8S1K5I6_PARPR|nr:unnamed protein product [Paramecium primaurelia]
MNQKRQHEEFIEKLPWDDYMHHIPIVGASLTVLSMIFEYNIVVITNLLTTGIWIYYLEKSKRDMLKYYKSEMQEIVSKIIDTEPRVQVEIKKFNSIQRNTQAYFQLFIFTFIFQILALYFAYSGVLTYKNPIDLVCYSLLSLFVFLSNRHFESRYQTEYNRDLMLQIRVLQGGLVVLSIVMSRYAIQKMDDFYNQFVAFGLLLCSALFSSYTFHRYGKTSKKSFTLLLVGAVFLFLSDALNIVLKVQRKELFELTASANVLYHVGYYFLVWSLFLHAKAYNDHFLLLLRMKMNI